MKTLYFDCSMGISGDMMLGALLDAGASFENVKKGLESLGVAGYRLSVERVSKSGISATQFKVVLDHPPEHHHTASAHSHHDHEGHHHEHPHDHTHEHTHSHAHDHHDEHHHDDHHHEHARHLKDIIDIIEKASLPDDVKKASILTFQRIGECEARIHSTTIDRIHFHEVGAIDSIVDIVGAHLALRELGAERIVCSPIHVGSGTVLCDHGVMPVPAPATAALLRGAPIYGGTVPGELTTPTGAALITQVATEFGPMPLMTIETIGYGSGTRNYSDRPNVLRVMVGASSATMAKTETIVVIETNLDNMNPELLPPLLADMMKHGARDVFMTPVLGKKGRPGHVLTALCDEGNAANIVRILFYGSTTLGIRMRTEQRICLNRRIRRVKTQWGDVSVKTAELDDGSTRSAPEFEDCRRLAEAAGAPVLAIYQAALAAAVKGEIEDV